MDTMVHLLNASYIQASMDGAASTHSLLSVFLAFEEKSMSSVTSLVVTALAAGAVVILSIAYGIRGRQSMKELDGPWGKLGALSPCVDYS